VSFGPCCPDRMRLTEHPKGHFLPWGSSGSRKQGMMYVFPEEIAPRCRTFRNKRRISRTCPSTPPRNHLRVVKGRPWRYSERNTMYGIGPLCLGIRDPGSPPGDLGRRMVPRHVGPRIDRKGMELTSARKALGLDRGETRVLHPGPSWRIPTAHSEPPIIRNGAT
jgi:hypothetical protein